VNNMSNAGSENVGPLPSAGTPLRPVGPVGHVPSRGVPDARRVVTRYAGSGDPAYKTQAPVGHVPSRGVPPGHPTAGSGDPAYKTPAPVGRVPTPGVPTPPQNPPHRLRRLHRVWPDRDGNISYLLTPCVDGRTRVLDNEATFDRLVAFLLDSPSRYHWFPRRFVVMPDHIHLIAHMGNSAVRLGEWVKALKAVVAGLKPNDVGRVPLPGAPLSAVVGRVPPRGDSPHPFTRIPRSWRWQSGFHDHKFRTPEAETRKWEYICLNPVRAKLVERPEHWPFAGEIFYDEAGGPRLVRGTPPLLEIGMLILEDGKPFKPNENPPAEGSRPTA
jgi:hypothetical protein